MRLDPEERVLTEVQKEALWKALVAYLMGVPSKSPKTGKKKNTLLD